MQCTGHYDTVIKPDEHSLEWVRFVPLLVALGQESFVV